MLRASRSAADLVIPTRDVIPTRTRPFVTLGLIGLNTFVFACQPWLGELLPFLSMFLHASLLHLAATMLYLWLFGESVEDRMGHGRFAFFYVLCAVAVAFLQAGADGGPVVRPAGSGGAISGIMGAYFVLHARSSIVVLVPLLVVIRIVEIPAIAFLGVWFLMPFMTGAGSVMPDAAGPGALTVFWTQGAGFVLGAGSVLVLRRPERQRVEWWNER